VKIVLKYLLPATLIAGFLFSFCTEALQVTVSSDDCFFDAISHQLGIAQSIFYCYGAANGRWFSHLVSVVTLYFAGHHYMNYVLCVFFFTLLFVLCLARLFYTYAKGPLQKDISPLQALYKGLLFTALLYFIVYSGRRETWFWLSSAANHLLSVSLSALLFSLLLQPGRSLTKDALSFLLAALVGGLNEVNALSDIILALALFFFLKRYRPHKKYPLSNFLLVIVGIALSLVVNFISRGYRIRMEVLPDFSFMQSLKNTLHSFLLIFLDGNPVTLGLLLALAAGGLVILFRSKKTSLFKFGTKEALVSAGLLIVVGFSFFVHCYTLSDIIPARGALWGYTLFLFVFSARFLFLN